MTHETAAAASYEPSSEAAEERRVEERSASLEKDLFVGLVASASGFTVTLLYVVRSIFPIIDVTSWLSFAGKISGVVIGLNVVGAALFWSAARRRAQ